MSHAQAATPKVFDETDPHGQHGRIHHHTYSWQFLTGVLLALLFFTLLTIFVAQLEGWVIESLAIPVPHWVNVVIAMGIATVKASLVLLFFMGLRRGNPVNAMIFLFTLFAFAMFLGFTALDLQNRGHVYEYKAESIELGGTGHKIRHDGKGDDINMPIYLYARQAEIQRLQDEEGMTEEEAKEHWLEHYNEGHEHAHGPEFSTANRHIRRTGLTPGLFADEEPVVGDHHAGNPEHHEASEEAAHQPAPNHDQPAEHE